MDLAFLHPLYERPGPWASVYVDTSRHTESTTPHERSLLAQDASRQLAEQGADEATCAAVRAAMEELRFSSDLCGRALFANGGEVVLDPSLASVPLAPLSTTWGMLPRVAPLLDLVGEDPLVLVAYIDRTGAHFELRSGGSGPEDAGSVTGSRQWPMHRTSSVMQWSERHFELKVENTWAQNAAEIADALDSCQQESGADLIILVGDERERAYVHERIAKRLLGCTVQAPHGTGSRLLDEDVERLRAQHVHQRAAGELDRFLSARSPDDEGRVGAVEGVPALVDAARQHQIDELLIRMDGPDAHREVWIGESPDMLAVKQADLKAVGQEHTWSARADDALLRAAVATGAPALSMAAAGPGDTPSGGLGALLRWS